MNLVFIAMAVFIAWGRMGDYPLYQPPITGNMGGCLAGRVQQIRA
jgi:hypothetical protein